MEFKPVEEISDVRAGRVIMYRFVDPGYEEATAPYLEEYVVVKKTKCGVWVKDIGYIYYSDPDSYKSRWISNAGTKRFAYETKEAALKSYYHRKVRQVKLLESRLRLAKAMKEMAHKCTIMDSPEALSMAKIPLDSDFIFD